MTIHKFQVPRNIGSKEASSLLSGLLLHRAVESIAYCPGTGDVVVREDRREGEPSVFAEPEDVQQLLPRDPLIFSRTISSALYSGEGGGILDCAARAFDVADQKDLVVYAALLSQKEGRRCARLLGVPVWKYEEIPAGSLVLLCGREDGAGFTSATTTIGGHYELET